MPHDPHEWVDFPVATYVEHDGETRCSRHPAAADPRHTDGHQSVLVDTPTGSSSSAATSRTRTTNSGAGATEGQRRVLALAAPTWLTHAEGGPKVPRTN